MPTHTRILPAGLIGQDRHYNPGLLRFRGHLWLCYRTHAPDGHCKMAISRLDPVTFQPIPTTSQWLPLKGVRTEDGRLFMHNGEPYIAYTELTTYVPNVDYTCTMRYARLKLGKKGDWQVLDDWQPAFGWNTGKAREKNWQFFSHDKELWCVYGTSPTHRLIRIEQDKITQEIITPGPSWAWGHARGGTPPIKFGDVYLSILHSSRIVEVPIGGGWRDPFTLRYHAAAYTFEAKPPFKALSVSRRPILIGNEKAGFFGDPRNPKFEDPLTVFPCGMVEDPATGDLLVSYGVNNWQCWIARFKPAELQLIPSGSEPFKGWFRTANGTLAISVLGAADGKGEEKRETIIWTRPRMTPARIATEGHVGYLECHDAQIADSLVGSPLVTEITEAEYRAALL